MSALTTAIRPAPRPTSTSALPQRNRGDGDAAEPGALRKFRPDIQGLRAIAVLLVVLYHADVPFVRAGYVGVDVFFVISGFLITGALVREAQRTGRISLLTFYVGRTRRLLLPAAAMVVVTLALTRAWVSVFQIKGVTTDAIWSMFSAINYRLAEQGIDYQQSTAPPSPLQHMWSLAVEEQFYAVWPLLVIGAFLLARGRRPIAVLSAVLAVVAVTSLYYSVTDTVDHPPLAYFSIHTRAWELAAGAAVYLAATQLRRLPGPVAAIASWLGVAGILASAVLYSDDTAFPGSAAVLPVASAALVIAAGCRPSRGSAETLLARRPFQALGAVSYSWYLWHWPLVVLVPLFAGYGFSWPLKLEVMALALWVAVLSYFILEAPAKRSRLRRPAWLGIGAASTVVVVGLATAVVASLPALVGSGRPVETVALEHADTSVITTALASGLTIQRAPSNLTPSIATVSDDQPASSTNGCHANFPVVDQGSCVFGDPKGTHTLVLIGDSHAQQWLPAFDQVGADKGWRVVTWTKAACPIAEATVFSPVLSRTFTECDTWRSKTLAKVKAARPDLVVMSGSDSVPGTQLTNTEWADSTVATIQRVRADGTPVVYLMDTPVPKTNVPDCVARNLGDIGACVSKRVDSYRFPGRHEQLKATLTEAKVATVEPLDLFCAEELCPVVVGNLLVYRDDSHISTEYASWLAPMVKPLFVAKEDR